MSVPMSTSQPQASSSDVQEHIVRVPRERRKKYSMMKIGSGVDLDFSKLHQAQTSVRIERENNFKEYKNAYDIDSMPKFGAGSEYGREQKEEARRKKYGIRRKNYNPEDQPWLLKVGQGKNTKKYKGVREGTIADNTSYYIFTKCADGAFEATPVEEWYNYTPQIRYKYLNSEEAEEEFSRRDKTLNLFNIMVKRRVRGNDGGEGDEEAGEKLPKGSKKKKDFKLTDMEDWAALSDDDDDDDDDEDRDEGDAPKKKPGKGKGKIPKKKSKNAKHNSDDEAIEESDEGDYDDREVDYMSDSGMSSSESEVEEKEKVDKYEEKGVDEEAGLRKLIDSGEEDEDEEEKEEDNEEDKDKDGKGKKNAGSDSDSSSSSSGSDSDIEKDDKISSALFMQKGSEKKKERTASPKPDERGTKRKGEGESSVVKKPRTDSPLTTQSSGGSSEGITEDAIRRYLSRKPMTTKDLLQKFKSKKLNMTNEQMTHTIAVLLKRINPNTQHINKVMYLSLKSE